MKVLCRTTPRELVIYRERRGVIAFVLSAAMSCLAMGAAFAFYVAGESDMAVFAIFGWAFMIIGLLVLASLPKFLRHSNDIKGFPIFKVAHEYLSCSPLIGMHESRYRWNEIKKLVIAERLVHSDADGKTEEHNAVVIIFREDQLKTGFLENARHQRSRAPTGELYSHVPFPSALSTANLEYRLKKFLPKSVELQEAKRFVLING